MLRIVAIIIATLLLTYAAWANSASTLFSKFSPERGLRLAPDSAQALMNMTDKAAAKKTKTAFLKIARANSIAALRSEPLSSRALRQLGVYYATMGDVAKGRKFVQMSAKLSHRDTPGQLWLMEDYLRNDKPREGLRAIDIVIRTQAETREAAYAALGTALADPEFRKVFIPYVRNQPSWLKPFIQYNVRLQRPEFLSRTLIQMMPLAPGVLDEPTASELLGALVDRGPIEDARVFYLKLPGTSARTLTSISFGRPADTFSFPPFGWETMNHGDVQGFGDVEDGNVSIEGLAIPGRSGIAARKLLFLRPGTYRWTGDADLSGMNGGGSVSVNLLCNIGPGQWSRSSSTTVKARENQFLFAVNPSCPAQLLTIDISGADTQVDASMRITNMKLIPAKNVQIKTAPPAKSESPANGA